MLFPDTPRVTDADRLPLNDANSPFTEHGVTVARAIPEASHVFIESGCSRSLTLIADVLPYLPDEAVICDLLPVKTPFIDYLRDVEEQRHKYIGAHWLRPVADESLLFAFVTGEPASLASLRDDFPSLYALIEAIAGESVALTADEHDHMVARRIQLPGLLENACASKAETLDLAWGYTADVANHPALQYDALIANQARLLDHLSGCKSTVQRIQNHLFSEDEHFFEQM